MAKKIVVSFEADNRQMLRAFSGSGKAVRKFGEQVKTTDKNVQKATQSNKKFGGGLSALKGAFVTLAASAVILKVAQSLGEFVKQSVTAASRAEETASKFKVVFGESAASAIKAIEEQTDAVNRSAFDWMEYAATIQDTLVPLGFARDAAAGMSVEIVALAEDLASFNDIDTAIVVRDIQSAIVGNTETLRKYGVVAQETQIKQEALSAGLWDGTGAIDANSKAQAILNLIISGTADAQGDAERTADSYANQTKNLEASILDLKVAIGDELIPTLAEGKGGLAEWVDELTVAVGVAVLLKEGVDAGIITQKTFGIIMDENTGLLLSESDAVHLLTEHFARLEQEEKDAEEATAGFTSKLNELRDPLKRAAELTEDLSEANKDLVFTLGELSVAQLAKEQMKLLHDEYLVTRDIEAYIEATLRVATGLGGMGQLAAEAMVAFTLLGEGVDASGEVMDLSIAESIGILDILAGRISSIPGIYDIFFRIFVSGEIPRLPAGMNQQFKIDDPLVVNPDVTIALGEVGADGGDGGDGTNPAKDSSQTGTFGGALHGGGKVYPGNRYLVSEFNQPEVFIPQTRGEVVPGRLGVGGGGGGLTVVINYNGVSLGNRLEAEEVLIPLVEKAFREFALET